MDIFLRTADKTIKLPVLPNGYTISTGQNNQVINTVSGGEILLKGKPKLKTIEITSFFPKSKTHGGYSARSKFKPPLALINLIGKWRKDAQVVRLIISETNINMLTLIDSFDYGQEGGSGDFNFSISFTEYKNATVKKSNGKKTTLLGGRETKMLGTTYTVKPGDTLKKIAKKQLGSSSKYLSVAKLNGIKSPYTVKTGMVIMLK